MTRAATQRAVKKNPVESHLKATCTEDLSGRDSLIGQYLPYATSIANKVAQTLSNDADIEEIICNARLGLLEAAKRFDPK